MINLLPGDEKREIYAGRSNSLLVKYNLLMIVVGIVTILILGLVFLYLQNTKNVAENRLAKTQDDSLKLAAEKKENDEFKSNLATAKQILDKRIDYSTVILRVANVVPSGVVLSQLTLDPGQFNTPVQLNIKAKSETDVLKFKDILNESKYFSDAHIDTITTQDAAYSRSAVLTVTVNQEIAE